MPLLSSILVSRLNRRTSRWSIGGAAALAASVLAVGPIRAQQAVDVPSFAVYGSTDSSLMATSGQARQNLSDADHSIWMSRGFFEPGFPRDSVKMLQHVAARTWLARLPKDADKSIGAEPLAQVYVAADEDDMAQKVLAKRVATPGLSVADKAYALYAGVVAFADPTTPARFDVAERYMKELNAMGPKASMRRYLAELVLVDAYRYAGRTADVSRCGEEAIKLMPQLAMKDLRVMHDPTQGTPYMGIASAVAVQPNGQAKIKEMNSVMTNTTVASADSVAMDSAFYWGLGEAYMSALSNQALLGAVARLGTMPGPISSNRWLNVADTGKHDLQMNDGTIRVIEVAALGCPGCQIAARRLQSYADVDSTIHPILITWTGASWANRVVTPDSSASMTGDFWVNHMKLRYPIAMWIAYQRDTLSDGSIVESLRDDSAAARYPETGFPQFYIIDGKGRIRASFMTSGQTTEQEILRTVHALTAEQKQEQHASARVTPISGTASGE